jgi:hypothetical protein
MTCSTLSAIIDSADSTKYARNPRWRSAAKAICGGAAVFEVLGERVRMTRRVYPLDRGNSIASRFAAAGGGGAEDGNARTKARRAKSDAPLRDGVDRLRNACLNPLAANEVSHG